MALAEAIHRARNDLQAVASMLRLQARVACSDEVRNVLHAAEIRVIALSTLNARLDAAVQDDSEVVDTGVSVGGLVSDLQTMHFSRREITLDLNIVSHGIAAKHSKPLGLIISDLVVNALKYAFADGPGGAIRVSLQRRDDNYLLAIADNGVGIDRTASAKGTGLGTRLVRALAVQIGGRFTIGPVAGGGTQCILTWPVLHGQG